MSTVWDLDLWLWKIANYSSDGVSYAIFSSPSDNTASGKLSTQVKANSVVLSEAKLQPTDAGCANVKYDIQRKPAESVIGKVNRNPI